MSRQIKQLGQYKMYSNGTKYTIHDSKKEFEQAHTHIYNYYVAISVLESLYRKRIPKLNSKHKKYYKYAVESILRLAENDTYIRHIKEWEHNMDHKDKKQECYKQVKGAVC